MRVNLKLFAVAGIATLLGLPMLACFAMPQVHAQDINPDAPPHSIGRANPSSLRVPTSRQKREMGHPAPRSRHQD